MKKKSSIQNPLPINTHGLKLGLKTCLHAPTRSEELYGFQDNFGNMIHEIDLIDAADNVIAFPLKLIISRCPSNSEINPEIKAMLRMTVLDWIKADSITREGIENIIDDLIVEIIRPLSITSELSKSNNSSNFNQLNYSGLNETSSLSTSIQTNPSTISSTMKEKKIPNFHV